MTIGENIRAYRKRRGLTQGKLGELCGMTGGAISSYEKGATIPRRRVVEKIARALDISADKLTQASPPDLPAGGEGPSASDALLYDGVLTVLKQRYGIVEGRIILGENGASRKYYVIRALPDDFILYESDISAIVRSAKASLPPMAEHMRSLRGEGA